MTLDKMQEVLESEEKWNLKEEWNPKKMWESENEWNKAVEEINNLASQYKELKSEDALFRDTYNKMFSMMTNKLLVCHNNRRSNDANDTTLDENVFDVYWAWDKRKVCEVMHVYETLEKKLRAFVTSNTQHSFWRFFTYPLKTKPLPSPGKPPPTPPEELDLSKEHKRALRDIDDFCKIFGIKPEKLSLEQLRDITGYTRKSTLMELWEKYMWQNKNSLDYDLGDGNTFGGTIPDEDHEPIPEAVEKAADIKTKVKEYARARLGHKKLIWLVGEAVKQKEDGYENDMKRMMLTHVAVEFLVGSKEYMLLKKVDVTDKYFITNFEESRDILSAHSTYNLKEIEQASNSRNHREHEVSTTQLRDWCEAKSLFIPPVSCKVFAMGEFPTDKEYRMIGKCYGINVVDSTFRRDSTQVYVRNVFKSVEEMIAEEAVSL